MAETFDTLLERPGVLIERIVSQGETTPADAPYQQAHDEWVMVVSGAARVLIEGGDEQSLAPGDHLLIPRGARHWVTFTARDTPTIWIAVHLTTD
jgi:cupin 2 domain-containing protein